MQRLRAAGRGRVARPDGLAGRGNRRFQLAQVAHGLVAGRRGRAPGGRLRLGSRRLLPGRTASGGTEGGGQNHGSDDGAAHGMQYKWKGRA